ncbi:MAG TPA: BsuPI-related putative proteinase inhibitor [Candidatus Limnocylindrales bacterium]|nr:BsuPI-related putative proteinase inhibitor [Candidatus Limnocylindrales bacterium]
MALRKKQVLAIIAATVVFGAVVSGLALSKLETSFVGAPNSPANSIAPTKSPNSPVPTTTSSPSPIPTKTPLSTSPATTSEATVTGSFELTVSVEKTVYSVGEPVNITLAITNISSKTANFTHTGMDFDFIVTNGTDNLVYQWSIGRAFPMFAMIEPLQPGENVTATYVWPQTCNSNPSTTGTSVSPGTYYIIGKSNSIYELQTNPLQITIGGS